MMCFGSVGWLMGGLFVSARKVVGVGVFCLQVACLIVVDGLVVIGFVCWGDCDF